jgi:hypothetical protein
MKTCLTILFLLVASISFSKPRPKQDYKVLSTKNQTLYFKVNKLFVGGVVEVYNENEVLMESEDLSNPLTMIYFDEMPVGRYIIKIKKDGKFTEIKYNNI